ncbi:hypothetical protein BwSF19_77310 [Bradyrhizobium ottawaense]|nr:hypothetical protein BwSF19_77310 [Bradyrhizobium ottawaense]
MGQKGPAFYLKWLTRFSVPLIESIRGEVPKKQIPHSNKVANEAPLTVDIRIGSK